MTNYEWLKSLTLEEWATIFENGIDSIPLNEADDWLNDEYRDESFPMWEERYYRKEQE